MQRHSSGRILLLGTGYTGTLTGGPYAISEARPFAARALECKLYYSKRSSRPYSCEIHFCLRRGERL